MSEDNVHATSKSVWHVILLLGLANVWTRRSFHEVATCTPFAIRTYYVDLCKEYILNDRTTRRHLVSGKTAAYTALKRRNAAFVAQHRFMKEILANAL